MRTLLLFVVLLFALSGCSDKSDPSVLYANEEQAFESGSQALTQWATQLLHQVAENNKDVQAAFALVELEQQRELTAQELEEFEQGQQNIQRRSTDISALFDQGGRVQLELFKALYQLLGKLDAGAQFCKLDTASESNLALISKPSQVAWPELESAYQGALTDGQRRLESAANYPCEQFATEYQALQADLRRRVSDIKLLMASLTS